MSKSHEEFSKAYEWWFYAGLKGDAYFPSFEIPESVGAQIDNLVQEVKSLEKLSFQKQLT